jgi:amidohydrolase
MNTGDLQDLKQRVIAEAEAWSDELIRISDAIHARPELGFEEFEAAALLAGTLEENGFTVQRGVAGMETAFIAALHGQDGGPTVAFLAEYDALPGLGHACGHNIIGTAAMGAGLAMKAVLPDLAGTIQVIGTPAEEGGGGKAIMVDAGVFADVDVGMMVHPSSRNLLGRLALTAYPVHLEFFGKAAHAAAKPDEGINALDAMLLTFAGINALRQHLRDDARIHGIITHGGDAANIIPDHTAADFIIRAADTPYATQVLDKVQACAEGAALATGACLDFEVSGPRYDARWPNPTLVELFKENLIALGLEVEMAKGNERLGSSDIGNVSQVIPTIHPYLAIAPDNVGGHTVEFREAAASPAGHQGLINAVKALAMTAVGLLVEPENVKAAWRAFEQQKASQSA